MRPVLASNIMRTTIDLDPTVLSELRDRSRREGKSMGQLASELLAPALAGGAATPRARFRWKTHDAGRPRVDLEDKELVWQILDQSDGADQEA